jgi:mono/diheme cytochrome c family protein
MRVLARIFVVVVCALSAVAQQPAYLNQNWSQDDRQWFYATPQGSKLILYDWAMALELANEETLWSTNLERFYFLPSGGALPVGLLKDGEHLGLTCAACHTNQLEYNGKTYQIDGAPTNADLWAFLDDLGDSLKATAASASSPKFTRFAGRVLSSGNTPAGRAKLFAELTKYNDYFQTFRADSRQNVAKWGRARTDAFGMIFNRVTVIDLKVPSNNRRPNAPVSYPFLWDTSWHNKVQWNGIAPNRLVVERLARNVGEVLGVFAQLQFRKPRFPRYYYESTVDRMNLIDIEDRLSRLRSPQWTEIGTIDQARAARGKQLYDDHCIQCHTMATPGRHQDVVMTPQSLIGTDEQMALISATRTSKTGVLQGVRKFLLFGTKMKADELSSTITGNAVVGAILSPVSLDAGPTPMNAVAATRGTNDDRDDPERARLRAQLLEGPRTEDDGGMSPMGDAAPPPQSEARAALETELRAFGARVAQKQQLDLEYKARPLDGIWATAPYLHNGSVPTLYALLMPSQRPAKFWVGSRQFDPVRVGFMSENETTGAFHLDTSIQGNLNAGHTTWWKKGASSKMVPASLEPMNLTESEAMDLIEYLKSL